VGSNLPRDRRAKFYFVVLDSLPWSLRQKDLTHYEIDSLQAPIIAYMVPGRPADCFYIVFNIQLIPPHIVPLCDFLSVALIYEVRVFELRPVKVQQTSRDLENP
jgi:hypothetical protein